MAVESNKKYMELAIKVMLDSKNEPRPDGKVPPQVGVVIVFPDGNTKTAFRGELREGDHAEYTLMERKLAATPLEDCVLFTTLEPCAERNEPKIPCCRRTTNARIKKVFVGIEDPDPTVSGKGIKYLENHGVKVEMFDREFQKLIEKANKDFLKQAIERKKQAKEKDLQVPLEKPIPNYDTSKFNYNALNKFIIEAKLDYDVNSIEFNSYLTEIGALDFDETNKKFTPTGFGVLLFGNKTSAKFKNAVLKAHINYGNNTIESKDFDGPLVLIPDQIEEWLNKVLPHSKNTESFKREDVPIFPMSVLREAVINAIVHRDYEEKGAKSSIAITPSLIKINSAGKPLPAISLEDLNSFSAPSLSRNPIISYVFNLMGYVEETGFGMQTFKSLNKDFGLPIPKYTFKNPFLTLTFPRTSKGIKSVIDAEAIESLSDQELGYFELFREQELVTKTEFVEHTNLPDRTAQRLLKDWVDNGLIESFGAGRSTRYKMKN